jgi:phosphoribosyl-ATP pyrophosphohydrolase/phosphoribosyl-AMP cyclohydrolase
MTDGMTDRTIASPADLDGLKFDDSGLIPVVAQDAATGAVLMVAWANREALAKSLESGLATFWSRSRQELWTKGETSGNTLTLVSMHGDCDADTVLALVKPAGPACHTGELTCFGRGAVPSGAPNPDATSGAARVDAPSESTIPGVWATLVSRAEERPEGSYTVKLLDSENLRIKKLGEETAELIQALVKGQDDRAAEEAADLFYHMLAALLANGVSLEDVLAELESRR